MTLPEVLTALVIMSVIGAAVTGVFVSQSQLHDSQEKHAAARSVSRGAVNLLMSELRMLERTGAVVSASPSAVEVDAPFAFGLLCTNGAPMVVARVPGDTLLYNAARTGSYVGYAWLNRETMVYTFVPAAGNTPSTVTATNSACDPNNAPRMRLLPVPEGGGAFTLSPAPTPSVPVGTTIMLLHRVKYEFKASDIVPGRIGLFRYMGADTAEIAAPFDATARFRFYANDALTSGPTPPTPLSQLTGLEVVLDGVSERPNRDGTFPRIPYRTSVFFRNRL